MLGRLVALGLGERESSRSGSWSEGGGGGDDVIPTASGGNGRDRSVSENTFSIPKNKTSRV